MNDNGAGRELGSTPPAEPECKLAELVEAIQAKKRPADCIGVVACGLCNGVFDIHYDIGEKPTVENLVFVPCMWGYSNNPEAHLAE